MDNTVQTASGTVKFRATVPNADDYFWPGQFVNVRLVLSIDRGAVLIPAEAQQLGQQGPYVYVIGADDVAQMRPIVLGQRHGSSVVVLKGLKAGERVVTTGHGTVMPTAKVQVIEPGGPKGAGGPPGMQASAQPKH